MKKFVAIFVCLCLLLVPIPVYAVDSQEVINDSSDNLITQTQESVISPIIDPDESWRQLALNKIRAKYGEQASTMAQSQGLVNGAVYRIRNMDSDKYLNVHYGVDANGTNVYQWSYDGSTEQKFKLVYNAASDSYKLYAMCSSNGNNRVIDVARNGSPLGSGQNVGIWTPIDDTAQRLQIDFLQNNLYVIRMKANPSMFVAVNGTANGTASGKLSTSPGNVYIDTYDVWRSQEWFFELVSHPTAVAPTGCLEAVTNTQISGWAWRSDSPNLAVDVRVVLTNTSTNEQIPLIGTANLHRNDLQNSGYGNGNHGFIISIEWNLLPSGTYSISAYGVGATGTLHLLSGSPKTYTVSNAVEDEFKGSMTLNSSYTSYLYPGQTHIYSFTPPQTDYYRIFTTGSTDVYGELRYDESTILDEDDTDGEGPNFKIEYKIDANHTYYIYVRGFTQTASGNYTIKIESMFLDKLQELHELAKNYTNDNLPRSVELTMQYIRRGKYNGEYKALNQWALAAGDIDSDFVTYVHNNNTTLEEYFTIHTGDDLYYYDPTGKAVDIPHLAAIYNAYEFESLNGMIGLYDNVVNLLSGWGGDLRSIVPYIMKNTNYSTDYTTVYNMTYNQIGVNSNFNSADLMADVDAVNIRNNYITSNSNSLKTTFSDYYLNGGINYRFTSFSLGVPKSDFCQTVKIILGDPPVDFVWPYKKLDESGNETDEEFILTQSQIDSIAQAFADFVWDKIEAENS